MVDESHFMIRFVPNVQGGVTDASYHLPAFYETFLERMRDLGSPVHALAFLHARLPGLAGAPQAQASPRRRFDPGKVILRPRPTDQLDVDVVRFFVQPPIARPAAEGQERGGAPGAVVRVRQRRRRVDLRGRA